MTAEKLAHAWHINAYINGHIQSADAKASAIIGVAALGAGALALLPDTIKLWNMALIVLSFLPLLIGLIYALFTLYPRTKPGAAQSTVYWKSIANYASASDYRAACNAVSELDEVTEQNYYLAKVAGSKYRWITCAVQWQVWGVPFFLVNIVVALLF